jgi:DNA repair protein SbcC/Rad50
LIKKIKLKNFRSHNKIELNFSPNVNIICGDNDLGKSSLLRALNWVAFNKPSGDSFIKHKEKKCSVSIELENILIERKKNKNGDNSYTIYKDGEELNKFSAIGQTVPDEIKSILKIDGINIQNQHDKAFLLSESSGYISKYLNKLVGLDLIDSSIKRANSEIRFLNSEIKRDDDRLVKLNSDKESLSGLPKHEEKYKIIVEKQKEYDRIEKEELELSNVINEIKSLNLLISKFKDLDVANKKYVYLSNLIEEIKDYDTKIEHIGGLINGLVELENKSKKINFKKTKKIYDKTTKLLADYNDVCLTESELSKTIIELQQLNKKIVSLDVILEKNRKEFKEKFPKKCPLCNQQIKGDII